MDIQIRQRVQEYHPTEALPEKGGGRTTNIEARWRVYECPQ